MMDSARDEKQMYCRAMVGFAALGCLINASLLTLLCRKAFRHISINIVICAILMWNTLQTTLHILKCFELQLSETVFRKFPLVFYFLDILSKRMLIGTVTILVVIRTISIVFPFALRKFKDDKIYYFSCLLPAVTVIPSVYFVKVSFENRQTCPNSMSLRNTWDKMFLESQSAIARISIEIFIYFVMLVGSAISICFLTLASHFKTKFKAIANVIGFLLFMGMFFLSRTTHDLVKECLWLERLVDKSEELIDLGLFLTADGKMTSDKNHFGIFNRTDAFKGLHCWLMVEQRRWENVYMDHIHFDRETFVNSFYVGRFLEVLGNCLLGFVFILPSCQYMTEIMKIISRFRGQN